MGFLQVITFDTDRLDEFVGLERDWARATAGRRTLVGTQLFADRDHAGRYVALDWFDSYESAMVNSALPETDALARQAAGLSTGLLEFKNLEPLSPARSEGEEGVRRSLETSTAAPDTFADDVDLDMLVPHGRVRTSGLAGLLDSLRAEAPGRDIEYWQASPTPTGFAVEYAYRTHGNQSTLAAGIMLVTLRDGLVSRLAITCAGSWSAETEARVVEETGTLGPREREGVR